MAVLTVVLLFLLRLQFLPRLELKDGQKIKVTGVLSEEPQISENSQKIKVGQFEFWTKRYPEYHFGDEVVVMGEVKAAPLTSFRLPLLSFNRYLIEAESVKSVASSSFSFEREPLSKLVKGLAISLRTRLIFVFNQVYPKPYDGVVSGIILGDKSLIPKDFWQRMQKTGTLHIMVASGMNIAMFSQGVLSFFILFFKRRTAILCLLCVIWFYSIMTGLAPPMVRAATMASLIYLSRLLGREAESGRILFATGLLMVFIAPALLFDIGFQLSFLATAGLVYLQPKLKRINFFLFKYENFSSSVASQLATLPILIGSFGRLNLLSPFINLIILWTIPFILQFGMVLGILGIVGDIGNMAAKIASYLLYPLLFYLEQIIDLFAKINIFQVELPKIGWWWGIGYYFVIYLWIRRDSRGLRADSRGSA